MEVPTERLPKLLSEQLSSLRRYLWHNVVTWEVGTGAALTKQWHNKGT